MLGRLQLKLQEQQIQIEEQDFIIQKLLGDLEGNFEASKLRLYTTKSLF